MATTIAISDDLKQKLDEFGARNETYSQILERMHKLAMERLVDKVFFDESKSMSLDEFKSFLLKDD